MTSNTRFSNEPDTGNDSDGSISSNSTIPSEPKSQYSIDGGILAERLNYDEKQYLVKWKGYDEHRNLWEPERSFQDSNTLKEWRLKKARIDAGLEAPFDMKACDERVRQIWECIDRRKALRRSRRAVKEKRLERADSEQPLVSKSARRSKLSRSRIVSDSPEMARTPISPINSPAPSRSPEIEAPSTIPKISDKHLTGQGDSSGQATPKFYGPGLLITSKEPKMAPKRRISSSKRASDNTGPIKLFKSVAEMNAVARKRREEPAPSDPDSLGLFDPRTGRAPRVTLPLSSLRAPEPDTTVRVAKETTPCRSSNDQEHNSHSLVYQSPAIRSSIPQKSPTHAQNSFDVVSLQSSMYGNAPTHRQNRFNRVNEPDSVHRNSLTQLRNRFDHVNQSDAVCRTLSSHAQDSLGFVTRNLTQQPLSNQDVTKDAMRGGQRVNAPVVPSNLRQTDTNSSQKITETFQSQFGITYERVRDKRKQNFFLLFSTGYSSSVKDSPEEKALQRQFSDAYDLLADFIQMNGGIVHSIKGLESAKANRRGSWAQFGMTFI